jgi:hypothetical protein
MGMATSRVCLRLGDCPPDKSAIMQGFDSLQRSGFCFMINARCPESRRNRLDPLTLDT